MLILNRQLDFESLPAAGRHPKPQATEHLRGWLKGSGLICMYPRNSGYSGPCILASRAYASELSLHALVRLGVPLLVERIGVF